MSIQQFGLAAAVAEFLLQVLSAGLYQRALLFPLAYYLQSIIVFYFVLFYLLDRWSIGACYAVLETWQCVSFILWLASQANFLIAYNLPATDRYANMIVDSLTQVREALRHR